MANPLKVLTQLSASKEAQFAEVVEMQKTVTISGAEANLRVTGGGEISGSGAFKNAGAAELGSTLAVAGNANLASALDVKGASALSGALGVVGIASFQADMSGSAGLDLVGAAHIGGALDLDGSLDVGGYAKVAGELSGSTTLNIGGASHLAGAAQLDSTLDVDGAAGLHGTLDVDGIATFVSDVTASANVRVGGNIYAVGDGSVYNLVVRNNLDVLGTTTTINSTTVTVADSNIQLATVENPTDSTALNAGFTIKGLTDKTFQWSNDAFNSSENMNLASGKVYKIDGEEVLAKDSVFAKLSKNNSADAFVRASASGVEIHAVDGVELDNELRVTGDIKISGGGKLKISGEEALANTGTAMQLSKDAGYAHVAVASNTVEITGDLSLADKLNVAGVVTFQSDLSASANADIGGDLHVAGGLDIDGFADFGTSAHIANYLEVGGDAKIVNNLTVSGSIDTLGYVKAVGEISGSGQLNIGGNAHFAGQIDVDGFANIDGAADVQGNLQVYGDSVFYQTLFAGGVASFASDVSASAGVDIAGALHVAQAADFDSTLNVDGEATFQDAITANSSMVVAGWAAFDGANVNINTDLFLSASVPFTNITTPIDNQSGRYNVDAAIHDLDTKVGQQGSNINNAYAALRFYETKVVDSNGMAAFTSSFLPANIEKVTVDVLVQPAGSGPWVNDLVSVQVKSNGSAVCFEVSAPAMSQANGDKIRLIAVQESGSLA